MMERLTQRNEQDTAYYFPMCFKKCDGIGYSMRCDKCELIRNVCEKLGEYEDLEEQGLILKLPCKVGSKVWWLNGKFIMESEVVSFAIDEYGISFAHVKYLHDKEHGTYYGHNLDIEKFGKTVFLTKEEAEKKLKEIESK